MTSAARCLILALLTSIPAVALAQSPATRLAVGGGVAGALFDDGYRYPKVRGSWLWVSVPLRGGLSVEGHVTFFPSGPPVPSFYQGGTTLTAGTALKIDLVSKRLVSVHGLAQAGLLRFSSQSGPYDVFRPHSTPSFDVGFSVGVMPRARWSVRADFTEVWFAGGGRGDQFRIIPRATLGLGYTLIRKPLATQREADAPQRKWIVGAQLGYSALPTQSSERLRKGVNPIGFMSYRVSRHAFIDASAMVSVDSPNVHSPWEGGRLSQGYVGMKWGHVRDNVGAFLRLRFGLNRFSGALKSITHGVGQSLGPAYSPSLDMGGAVEWYRRRTVFRMDFGLPTFGYSAREIVVDGHTLPQPGWRGSQGVQVSFGLGRMF